MSYDPIIVHIVRSMSIQEMYYIVTGYNSAFQNISIQQGNNHSSPKFLM